MPSTETLARQLGLFDPFGWTSWLLSLRWWQIVLVMWAISPGGIWLIRLIWAGRVLRFEDEWLSFLCDFLLGIAVACLVVAVRHLKEVKPVPRWLQIGVLVVAAVIAIAHMYQERDSQTGKTRLGPLSLYYNGVLYLVFVFLIASLMSAALQPPFRPMTVAMVVVAVVMMGDWLWAGSFYDAKHRTNSQGVSKSRLAHPFDEHPWEHRYVHLGPSLRAWADQFRR